MGVPLVVDVAFGGLLLGGIYAVISLGLNLQYGVAKILNLSHGEFIMLCSLITFTLYATAGINPLYSIFIVGIIAFILGILIYKISFQRIVRRSKTLAALEANSILLSFGLLFIIQNIAFIIWGREYRSIPYLTEPINIYGAIYSVNRIFTFAIAIFLSLLLYLVTKYTKFGMAIRAISSDKTGAQLVGIDVERYNLICFGLGALMAGIAGVLLIILFSFDPTVGTPYTLRALIILILGGTGNFLGSLIGGMILGVAESLTATLLDPALMMVVNYLIFILILLLKPAGLFTKRG